MARLRGEEQLAREAERQSARHHQLMTDIVELLQDRGPAEREDIAMRLTVASALRLNMALSDLVRSRRIESKGSTYRITGDRRSGVPTMTDVIKQTYKTRVPRDPCRIQSGGQHLSRRAV